jgi:RES domain-containing protein
MMVYRLAAMDYIHDRSGTGARLFGGRWNPEGYPCIYTSGHISLAFLEKYIHAKTKENMSRIGLLKIEIPDIENSVFHIDTTLLKSRWEEDAAYTQWLGTQILSNFSVVAFSVPSAIIPCERNIILNPLATHFKDVEFLSVTHFETDFRLLSKLSS